MTQATPPPAYPKRNGLRQSPMRRSPFGEGHRERDLVEKRAAVKLEELLRLHRCDFWHPTISQRSQPGWPDYVVLGRGWHAFLELKARSEVTGRRGVVSPAQRRYQAAIEASGGEWVSFCLPDDDYKLNAWLGAKTGREVVFT